MLKRWDAWPRRTRWLVGIVAVLLALAIVWALFVPAPDWLARHDVGSAKAPLLQMARDAARGRLLTLVAGLFAAGALWFTARNFTLSREGQVTDRYTKAIEQLGSKELDVRIGGIYALERVARDSAKDHPTVMEVLTAFIREHSHEQRPPSEAGSQEQAQSPRPDVQAAVTVLGRRDANRDIRPIDLTRADLAGADLTSADRTLTGANLVGANLTGVNLVGANLTGANLTSVNLYGADLAGANLTGVDLSFADLTSADLAGADLSFADLAGADLYGRRPTAQELGHPVPADDPNLTGANLTGANLDSANLTGTWWPEGAPVPQGWELDTDSRQLHSAGQAALSAVYMAEARRRWRRGG